MGLLSASFQSLRRSFTPCFALASVLFQAPHLPPFASAVLREWMENFVSFPITSLLFSCYLSSSSYLLSYLLPLLPLPPITNIPSLPPPILYTTSPSRFPFFSSHPPTLPPYSPRSSVHSNRPFRPSSRLASSRPSSLPPRAY